MRHVVGLEKALATFPRIQREAAAKLTEALNKGVEEIAARAKMLAPTDGPPAVIRDNIRTDLAQRGASGRRSASLSARVFVPNDPAFFARFQEFGTVKMRARPFFFVAVNSLRNRVRGRVVRALNAAAKAVARGR